MANDFIKIVRNDNNATEAAELLQYKNALRAAYEIGYRVRAKMRHAFDDQVNPIVWTDLETLWGIPTDSGETVYNLINGSIGSMEGLFQTADAKNLTERVV